LAQSIFPQEKTLRFEHFTVEDGLPQNTVNGIVKDKYGFMWFGTWNGLCRYDGYKFTIYKTDAHNLRTINHNRIRILAKDAENNIWVLTYDSAVFCRYNYETDDFTRFPRNEVKQEIYLPFRGGRSFLRDNAVTKEFTWHIHIDSLYLHQINNRTHKHTVYWADPLNRWALNDDDISELYLDDFGILWIGTFSGGINKANTRGCPFYYYYRSIKGKDCLIDNNARTISQDNKGNLWVGSRSKGITLINRANNKYTSLVHNPNNNNSLISDQVRKIYTDHLGYTWIGTRGGLDRYDPQKKQFFHYSITSKNKIPHNWVYVIMEDNAKDLWIGTWDGIAKYNRKNNQFDWSSQTSLNLKKPYIRDFIRDKKGNFWLTAQGQGLFNLKKIIKPNFDDSFQVIYHYNYNSKLSSISDNLIYILCEDENGMIWAGTNSGLDRINPENREVTHINEQNGLPDISIMGILSDKKGHLWVSHKRGLSCLDTRTMAIKNYTIRDGLQGIEFCENACFREPVSGEMFFGGTNGLNSFFPDSMKDDDDHTPNLVFTDLKIQNQPVRLGKEINGRIILKKPVYLTSEITLTHNDKSISIEFASLHFENPMWVKYQYILEGFDKEWTTTDASKREATYSNLDPGLYFFKVKASNQDGIWKPVEKVLKIKILPPWWETLVVRIIAILFLLSLVFLGIYWRISTYRTRETELNTLVQQRTMELEKKNLELLKEQIIIEEQSETLILANENLKNQQTRLEEYAEETQTQNEKLKLVNEQLMEHQKRIEAQSEELRAHADNLKEANDLLIEKQKLIQTQSQKLEESNQKLAILNSTKDRFFSIIAHDLRNPFHSVSGLSEILLSDHTKFSSEKIERFLSLIHTSSISGNNLLENLLQWSRSQTGRIVFKPGNITLANIIEENLNLLEGELVRKNISIKSTVEADIKVLADENMVNTIFRNLISNAIKFTYKNGRINISAQKHAQFIEVSVKDSGIGISEKTKNLLFRIDTNVSTKGTSNETGTGLGLILCHEFVEKHGGRIWVESEEGKGSIFKFTLPGL
jgi:signal transduction histidine kinase/ligand-binding sensor domain-containing protein